eukprot:6184177-Pleurochrysis_carterae.AAC.1
MHHMLVCNPAQRFGETTWHRPGNSCNSCDKEIALMLRILRMLANTGYIGLGIVNQLKVAALNRALRDKAQSIAAFAVCCMPWLSLVCRTHWLGCILWFCGIQVCLSRLSFKLTIKIRRIARMQQPACLSGIDFAMVASVSELTKTTVPFRRRTPFAL